MSKFSGRCDLYDHITGQGGWYDKDGNSVCFNQEGVGCFYADLLKDFEAFKKLTGSIIHQHVSIKIEDWFTEEDFAFIKERCPGFDYIKHTWQDPDKRYKCGFKEVDTYTFKYFNKSYTKKELNQHGIYITKDIHFDTLLDLLPYLPYIVSMSCGGTYYISDESYVDTEENKALRHCYVNNATSYRKNLADLYLEVCKNYFLYKLDERTKIVPISVLTKKTEDSSNYYLCTLPDSIDYMHEIKFVWKDGKIHDHWDSPKMVNEHTIEISKENVDTFLKEDIEKGEVMIKYVAKPKDGFPIYIN